MRAHERWDRIGGYDDPVGWVRRVAVNLLRDDYRRTVRKRRAVERLAARPGPVEPAVEPDGLARVLVRRPASSAPPWPSSTWTAWPWPTSPTSWVWPRAR